MTADAPVPDTPDTPDVPDLPAVRVVLVDDDPLVRAGLATIVDRRPDLSVVGQAADGGAALVEVARTRPDVVLMDVRMPGMDGIEATRRLTAGAAGPRVLVLTTFEIDDYVYDALRAGASGFVLKRALPDELVDAIRVVARGESLVFPVLTRRLVERVTAQRGPAPDDHQALLLGALTDREAEILRLLAQGLSNAEIAERLVITVHTAKSHVANVLVKLGARDRTQAVVFAFETGFVRPDAS